MNIRYLWNRLLKKMRGVAVANSIIHKTSKVEAGSQFINSSMGRYSFCGYDCKIINCDIGSFCSIADGVIIGGAQHPIKWGSTSPVFYNGRDSVKKKFSEFERDASIRTRVGNDVWIGERALIKGGITVGDGAVIGMGSVVTHDVMPYSIVAGNPASLVRYRYDEKVIKKYLSKNWWEKSDDEINRAANKVRSAEEFIEEIK